MRNRWLPGLVLLVTSATVGCTEIEQALDGVEWFAYMRSSPAFDPYEAPRPSPEGAVPFETPTGAAVPATGNSQAELQELAARISNPLPMDAASLASGQVMYNRHCAVCHGATGTGQGPVTGPGKFPFAPTIVSAPVQAYSDGYIYAVIRQGRGLMPAYGYRMSERERWAVVNYVRQLQQGAGGAGGGQAGADGSQAGAAAATPTQTGANPPQAGADTTDPGS